MSTHEDRPECRHHWATFLSGWVSNHQITTIFYQPGPADIQNDINHAQATHQPPRAQAGKAVVGTTSNESGRVAKEARHRTGLRSSVEQAV
ncbi:MAG: hypothetical protein P0121_08475 [Nitrospira sp.]|nr:hypothetical protein [Nitrospira sp.]